MLEIGLITLREGLESFLIVGMALSYLARSGRQGLLSSVYAGVASAFGLSVVLGLWLARIGGMDPIYEGILALLAAFMVISCTVHVLRSGKKLGSEIRAGLDKAATRPGIGLWIATFLFILLMVGREGAEAATMLASITPADGGIRAVSAGLVGLALAGLMALAWAKYGRQVNLTLFFRVTSVFMVLFSVQLVLYALHEFSEVGLLPFVDNADAHIVLEEYGPEGQVGQWLSYSLVLMPALFLVGTLIQQRFRSTAAEAA